jgi:transposase
MEDVMALYVKNLSMEERRRLEDVVRKESDPEVSRRAKIVLLSAQKVGVQDISVTVGLHPINVRKWIHRFNRYGINGLYPRRSPGRPRLFDERQRRAIVRMARTDPEDLGLDFPLWSLQRLRSQLIARGVVDEISAETIRQELLRGGLSFEERRWMTLDS